jgi:hypothetical protein
MPEIHQIFVVELAHSIDLDTAERLTGGTSARHAFRHRAQATSFLRLEPPPLKISQDRAPIALGRWSTESTVDVVLYDFGAATVTYLLPVVGGLEELEAVSAALHRSDALRRDAQDLAKALLTLLAPAVSRPSLLTFVEDYRIIGVRDFPAQMSASDFCHERAGEIARVLRPLAGPLSPDEARNATESRISFGPRDVTIVDWEAAFVLDPEPDDVRAVLEFANVQLLEMRWLDLQLDAALERSYSLLARRTGWRSRIPRMRSADVSEVAELQLDGAIMLERVTNAIKVFGEEYLTRIYRLAAVRFQLAGLEATITNKLATVESIYQKLSDRAATLRLEALEWIVIILIAAEIVLSIFR